MKKALEWPMAQRKKKKVGEILNVLARQMVGVHRESCASEIHTLI